MTNYEETGNPIEEVTFKFHDGSSYTARPDRIGDSIFGEFAHKIMYAYAEFIRRGNNKGFNHKIEFIIKWSEDIANNPNGIYSTK